MEKIVVVGQGYVGLPLSVAASKIYPKVIGFDTNKSRIDNLAKGQSEIEDISNQEINTVLNSQRFVPSSNW